MWKLKSLGSLRNVSKTGNIDLCTLSCCSHETQRHRFLSSDILSIDWSYFTDICRFWCQTFLDRCLFLVHNVSSCLNTCSNICREVPCMMYLCVLQMRIILTSSLCRALARLGSLKPRAWMKEIPGSKPLKARFWPACSFVRAAKTRQEQTIRHMVQSDCTDSRYIIIIPLHVYCHELSCCCNTETYSYRKRTKEKSKI